ncbi:MAG: hypothetical protein A2Y77_11065 [Planctomycetes bacterium RBG_13_62_9]|nr:MAG: hypothetical protein A2Y77_11065 [Planctomycetes bacterium RBG_13_62_9]
MLLMILLVSAGNHAQSPSAPPATAVGKLRILYAGHPGSEREKDFVAFLKKHFDVVQTGNLQTFKEADTQGFDVTLLDWDTNRYEGPQPRISQIFARPVITLGVTGGFICRLGRLKTGYL